MNVDDDATPATITEARHRLRANRRRTGAVMWELVFARRRAGRLRALADADDAVADGWRDWFESVRDR